MSSTYAVGTMLQSPGSPPGMTTSKSSKSSSFHSLTSDDGSVLADIGHFEDIGLDDEHGTTPKASTQILTRRITSPPTSINIPSPAGRTLAAGNRKAPVPRRSFPNLRNNVYSSNPRNTSTAALTADPRPITLKKGYSTTSLPQPGLVEPSPRHNLPSSLTPRQLAGQQRSQVHLRPRARV